MARRPPEIGAARRACLLACLAAGLSASAAGAGEADVVAARVSCNADRVCAFSVSVRHADTGWSHYADRYEILTPDGRVIATRVLRHPHVHEQPFTRSLAGVEIPVGVESVRVRARDSVDGYGGEVAAVALSFAVAEGEEAPESTE